MRKSNTFFLILHTTVRDQRTAALAGCSRRKYGGKVFSGLQPFFRRKRAEREKNLKKGLQKKKRHDILNNALWRGNWVQKEVNESNERRNPSQLSADYDYLRLR